MTPIATTTIVTFITNTFGPGILGYIVLLQSMIPYVILLTFVVAIWTIFARIVRLR